MQSVPETLKILIVGTPRTGNTWIKYCLSLIYDLRVVDFSPPEFWRPFDAHPYDQLGRRWIAHQHLPPLESLVRWARDRGLVLITTIQHPADTLVSLYHYVRNFRERTQSEQIAFFPARLYGFRREQRSVLSVAELCFGQGPIS
jgi:hypothetical protein